MDDTRRNETSGESPRHRWMLTFSIAGDLRFISHHDTLRLFQRALARAALPVRHSEGFNPHPRMTLPLPRPVGIASDAEAVIVEFDQSVAPDDLLQRLQRHTPADLNLFGVRRLAVGEHPRPNTVRYRIDPAETLIPDLAERACRLLASSVVPVERTNPKKRGAVEVVDIRPYLVDIQTDDQAAVITLRVTGAGTAKPAEVASFLGHPPGPMNHRIRRLEIQWE